MNQMHVVVSLGNALHVGSKSCLYEFTELKERKAVGGHGAQGQLKEEAMTNAVHWRTAVAVIGLRRQVRWRHGLGDRSVASLFAG